MVEIEGLELQGRHGVLDDEREAGQRFLFDVRLELSLEAGHADRIEETVDYRAVVAAIEEVSAGQRFRLLEALARAVAEALIDRFPLVGVRVRVRKPDVRLEHPVEWTAATVELGPSSR